MDSGWPKSSNSEDRTSCRISMYDDDDDDDEDTSGRVGVINYCLPTKTSNGTATSSDNFSFSENLSHRNKGSSWNDNDSYAKDQFERQVACKDAIDRRQLIDKHKHLCDFRVNECSEGLNSENANELESAGAQAVILGSLLQADEYNELVQKNNSEFFDEALSCESEEHEHDIEESCCDTESECRAEFNSMVHERNTEQFDEVLLIESDEDLAKNSGFQGSSCCVAEETFVQLSYSQSKELADPFFEAKVSESKVEANGYDATSHRRAYSSSKNSGSAMRCVERCNNLLSPRGYIAGQNSAMDSMQKREPMRPCVGSDQESENEESSGIGNNPATRSDDSDDSTRFCERSSEHQPFFSQHDSSERGTGDFLFRGSSLRGYPTPQYHLTRYPYSFNSELEPPSLLTSRYCQARMKRQSKKERQDATVVNSTDVPGYKGNLGVEELLSYINDSKGVGHRSETCGSSDASINRSAVKSGKRRKKGGSKGTEKPDRVEPGSKAVDVRTDDAKVDVAIKTNDRVRVKGATKLNCDIDAGVSDAETNLSDVSREQEISNDLIGRSIGDSSSTFQETCDIPHGNVDSIKTAAADRQLDKSLTQSSSTPLLRSMSNDSSMLRSTASAEDDFTMVTKKKKLKKNNSKRAKLPCSDCLPCFPVSSDFVAVNNDVHECVSTVMTASKEPGTAFYQKKSRHGTLSTCADAFKPLTDKTVTQDGGLYLEAHNERTGNDVQKKLSKVHGKAGDVHVVKGAQSFPALGQSNYDSAGSRSNLRHLSLQGKPTWQNREKQESKKSVTSAENLPLKVMEGASFESGVKQVTVEKQRHSKRPVTEQSKDPSGEKLELSHSGKQDSLPLDNVAKPQKDEKAKSRKLLQEEQVISQKLMLDEKIISENLSQDEKVSSESLSQGEQVISENLLEDEKVIYENPSQNVKPLVLSPNDEVISQELVRDDVDVFGHISPKLSENDMALSVDPSQFRLETSEQIRQDDTAGSQMLTQQYEVETSQISLPVEQTSSPKDSPDDVLLFAHAASANDSLESRVPPSEQPVVFLDRQRRLFSVPAKSDLGLKFGHFDDCDNPPDESIMSPYPSPVNFVHFIPVPYNQEDEQDKPMGDSNSMMYPIAHQYLSQLMYANGPLPPICKPAFQVYPNGHLFPVPMQFAPFVPPGFCIPGLPHTTNVPVGVVSPTMNNHTREETLSSDSTDCTPIIADGSESCVAGFAAMQGIPVIPVEPIAQHHLQPEHAEAIVANVSLSGLGRRCKSVFDVTTAVEYLYSEWLNVRRNEKKPNGHVVRYNPDLDL